MDQTRSDHELGDDTSTPDESSGLNDTIVAAAVSSLPSRRAIIRVSGPGTHAVASRLLRPAPERPGVRDTRLVLGGRLTLPVRALRFDTPRSYTGQDSLEIQLPGQTVLIERVLSLLTAQPQTRRAGPGEFTARALLNGRIGLDQAEGVACLIAASNRRQLDAARALVRGDPGRRCAAWLDELADLLALVEAGIDFTDQEDVVAIAPELRRERVGSLIESLETELRGSPGASAGAVRPRVVLAGPPSAGKSTLYNALLGWNRAVTDPEPGTTRDALVEPLDLSSLSPGLGLIDLVDTPGLASDPTAPGQELSEPVRAALESPDLIVLCDPTGRFDIDQNPMPGTLQGATRASVLRVRTKADRPDAPGAGSTAASPGISMDPIAVCALDGWNLSTLRSAIAGALTESRATDHAALLPRHREAMQAARDRLIEANLVDDAELVADSLRAAMDSLGEILGRVTTDDLLGRIFAGFCVGK